MKREFFPAVAFAMAAVMLFAPVSGTLMAAEDAAAVAQLDAKTHTSKTLWFVAGFFFSVLGWVAAYLIEPSPPASRLVGKSPEWVAVYTDAYKSAAKKIQTKYALYGCLTNAAVTLVLYAVYAALVASALSGAAAVY